MNYSNCYTLPNEKINLKFTNDFENKLSKEQEVIESLNYLFWKIGFNITSKGTCYLKLAILTAYQKQELAFNNKQLIELVSQNLNIPTHTIRVAMDNSIKSMYRYSTTEKLNKFFLNSYDGRNLTTKYFILLCINYLNNLTGKKNINMYYFI